MLEHLARAKTTSGDQLVVTEVVVVTIHLDMDYRHLPHPVQELMEELGFNLPEPTSR